MLTLAATAFAAFPGANGKIAFTDYQSGFLDVFAMNADGGGPVNLTSTLDQDLEPAWSADGTKIAFHGGGVHVMNADGSGRTTLISIPQSTGTASWSPDATRLAFWSFLDRDSYEIYVINADGTGLTRLTHDSSAVDAEPAWSPDGTTIAFSSHRATPTHPTPTYDIRLMDPDGSGERVLANYGGSEHEPNWSPDGTKIAYAGQSPAPMRTST